MANTNIVWRSSLGSIQAAIFKHQHEAENETRLIHNVNVSRRYRDGQDNWTSTQYFNPQDLGAAIALLLEAQQFFIREGLVQPFVHNSNAEDLNDEQKNLTNGRR